MPLGIQRFFRRLRRLSKKQQLLITLFNLVIIAGIIIFIWAVVTGRIKSLAELANQITNIATVTYQDQSGTNYTGQSNTVITELITSGNVNVTLSLQGRTDNTATSVSLKVYPAGSPTPVIERNDVSIDSSGNASLFLELSSGDYDFSLKVGTYLGKTLANQPYSEGMTLDFGQLRAGDLNNDTIVDVGDWAVMSGKWRSTQGGVSDINMDGIVDVGDWSIMSANWRQRDN